MRPDELETVRALIERVFVAFVAPDYTPLGCATFRKFIAPEELRRQASEFGQTLLVAADDSGRLAGVVAYRLGLHISMLFVEPEAQRKGLGRRLVAAAETACRTADPALTRMTVSAASSAIGFWTAVGFRAVGPETAEFGLRYTPMERTFPDK